MTKQLLTPKQHRLVQLRVAGMYALYLTYFPCAWLAGTLSAALLIAMDPKDQAALYTGDIGAWVLTAFVGFVFGVLYGIAGRAIVFCGPQLPAALRNFCADQHGEIVASCTQTVLANDKSHAEAGAVSEVRS